MSNIFIGNSISDHLTGTLRKLNTRKFEPRKVFVRNYSNYDTQIYRTDSNNIPWNNLIAERDLNKAWSLFKSALITVIDKHAPMVKRYVRGRDCQRLFDKIRSKMRERDQVLKKLAKAKTIMIGRLKKCYHVKNKTNTNQKSFKTNGQMITDKKEISNSFCSFFTNIGVSIQNSIVSICERAWKTHGHGMIVTKLNPWNKIFCFRDVTERYIINFIKIMNSSKSPGYDNISTSFIKDGMYELAQPLSYLLNLSLNQFTFPSAEKVAKVKPLYKYE